MAGNRGNRADDNRALQEDLRDNVVELNKKVTSWLDRKKGADLLIRLETADGRYGTEFLGTILCASGGYTGAGNIDWNAVKRWVVANMNDQVGEGFTENDLLLTHRLYGWTRDRARKAFDEYEFKSMVAGWEMGLVKLLVQEEDSLEYFEFENTKLLRQNGVLPSVEVEPEEGIEGGGGGRYPITEAHLQRASEAREQPEEDLEQRMTPISTEDADRQTRVLQMISSEDKNRRLDEFKFWTRVSIFFDFEEQWFETKAKELPGLLRSIDNYQLAAVFWLLTRYAVDGIAGPILGDDPGLGKTVIMIVTIKVHNDVQEAWADVMKFWKERAGSAEFKHNVQGAAKKRGIKCPSQKEITAKYGIQCPCVPGSDSQKIAESMQNWPSIIVGLPAQGTVTWAEEWEDTIRPDSRLQLYVNDANWIDHPRLAEFVKAIGDAPMPEGTESLDAALRKSNAGFEGGSRHVLLTSSYNCTVLLDTTEKGPGLVRELGETPHVPLTGCAIMALDEMHKYRGSKTKPLELLLDVFGQHKTKPTLGVAVSGSLGPLGPDAWDYMLQHTRAHARKEQLGRFRNGRDSKKVDVDWKYLQAHIDDPNAEQQNPFKECLGRLRGDWTTVMNKMFLRRGQRDEFMTKRIVNIPEPRHETVALAMPENNARPHVIENFRGVRLLMEERSEKYHMELALAQRKVLLERIPKGNAAETDMSLNYTLWTSTFPDLPFLAEQDETIVPFLKAGKEQQRLALQFSRTTLDPATANKTFSAINENLEKGNPFWAQCKTLRDRSPKMAQLEGLIRAELIGSKWSDQKFQRDNGPSDDSYVRHMLVFVRSPISAYLTALVLHRAVGKEVDVYLVHAGLQTESTAKSKPWHSRKGFRRAFNARCDQNSKNKIAVLTYELGATGWNMQRASVAVLLEVAARPEDRDQACKRVARRGQPCTPQIFELYYKNHLSEDQQKRHNDGIKEVKEIDWDYYGVTDGEGGSGEEEVEEEGEEGEEGEEEVVEEDN
ncbi:hypothetical protein PG988_006382 [Apiospora saccharicola]